jgi:anti-sigma regulatory factor (Ser/Thr protein kinase)
VNVAGLAAVTEPSFTREIAHTPECARLAREFLEQSIPDSPLLDSTRLIASELVTNAFQHGTGAITLTLTINPLATDPESDVRLSVTNDFDPVAGEPNLTTEMNPGQLVERGRGLPIVEALSSQWGWEISHSRLEVWASVTATS